MNNAYVTALALMLAMMAGCATKHDFMSAKLGERTYSCDAEEIVLETKKGNVRVKKGDRAGASVNTENVTWYCGHPRDTAASVIHCDVGTDLVEVERNFTGSQFVAFCYDRTGNL